MQVDLARGIATGQGRDRFPRVPMRVLGSQRADVIVGSARADRIYPGSGADLVRGHAGNDVIDVDQLDDRWARSADTVYAGDGDDWVSAAGGPDRVHGGAGDDYINGFDLNGPNADRIFAGPGTDFILDALARTGTQAYSGGPGADDSLRLLGWTGDLEQPSTAGTFDMATGRLTYEGGGDRLALAAPEFERVGLENGSWQVRGTDGDDRVDARATNGTRFAGLAGDDEFNGSPGNDWYDGGVGEDTGIHLGPLDECIDVEHLVEPHHAGPCATNMQ